MNSLGGETPPAENLGSFLITPEAQDVCIFAYPDSKGLGRLIKDLAKVSHPTFIFNSVCNRKHCTRCLPQILGNIAVAVGCGLIGNQDDWLQLVIGQHEIIHLCHTPGRRNHDHMRVETRVREFARRFSAQTSVCSCTNTISCKIEYHNTAASNTSKLVIRHRRPASKISLCRL